MNINFIQGVVQFPANVLQAGYPYVSLNAVVSPLIVVLASDGVNYLHAENTNIPSAWGPVSLGEDQWLYIDLNSRTGNRTFGISSSEPIYSTEKPEDVPNGQHWFDTDNRRMHYMHGDRWVAVIRVFVAKLAGGAVFEGLSSGSFEGSQSGNVGSFTAGYLLKQADGSFLRDDRGRFATTDVNITSSNAASTGIKVNPTSVQAEAQSNIAAYTLVKFVDFEKISPADAFTVQQGKMYGMITQGVITGKDINVITEGVISNPAWDWTSVGVGAPLYANASGQLVPTPPTSSQPAAAVVVNPQTIMLKAGVAATVGGPSTPQEIAAATTTVAGIVTLTVDAAQLENPIVVSDTDPRLDRASTTNAGIVMLSVEPDPGQQSIAVGTNDPRLAGGALPDNVITYDVNTGTTDIPKNINVAAGVGPYWGEHSMFGPKYSVNLLPARLPTDPPVNGWLGGVGEWGFFSDIPVDMFTVDNSTEDFDIEGLACSTINPYQVTGEPPGSLGTYTTRITAPVVLTPGVLYQLGMTVELNGRSWGSHIDTSPHFNARAALWDTAGGTEIPTTRDIPWEALQAEMHLPSALTLGMGTSITASLDYYESSGVWYVIAPAFECKVVFVVETNINGMGDWQTGFVVGNLTVKEVTFNSAISTISVNNVPVVTTTSMYDAFGIQVLNNIAIGAGALLADDPDTGGEGHANIAIGHFSSSRNLTGFNNVGVGDSTMRCNLKGYSNTAVGHRALSDVVVGSSNVALGDAAGHGTQYANDCTYVGRMAGANTANANTNTGTEWGNVYIGAYAGLQPSGVTRLVHTWKNTFVGYTAGSGLSTEYYGVTCLGAESTATGDFQLQLGNNYTTPYAANALHLRSDARDKTDIRDTSLGLNFLLQLTPREFRYDRRDSYTEMKKDAAGVMRPTPIPKDGSKAGTRFHQGLIAQELKNVMDSLGVDFAGYQDHSVKGGQDVMTIGYEEFITPLIKAVQELHAENTALKARIDAIELKLQTP